MKIIGYLIFACFYYIFRLFCPIRDKKVFAIMTHDGSSDGNVGCMIEHLKNKAEGYTFHTLKNSDRNSAKKFHLLKGKVSFFVIKPFHMATSEFILLDNIFLPMAYMKFPKRVSLVQLWHGTGTIKKFGQDVNTGKLKSLEKRANARLTHLIVNSENSKKEYAQAFGVAEDKVFVLGLPRTDLFFHPEGILARQKKFYKQFPKLVGKRLVLYAPTFRDSERTHPKLALDLQEMCRSLPEDYVFLLRLHPFVMEAYKKEVPLDSQIAERVISVSSYADINTLLLVSELLITDYSSIIFEYCLREKPMIFYAYDLEEFSDRGRGFYKPYKEYVPGPVVNNTQAVIQVLERNQFDMEKVRAFVKENYAFLDGGAAERLYLHIFQRQEM